MKLNFLPNPTDDTTLAELLNIPKDRKEELFKWLDKIAEKDSNFTIRLQELAKEAKNPEELLFVTVTHLVAMYQRNKVHVAYSPEG